MFAFWANMHTIKTMMHSVRSLNQREKLLQNFSVNFISKQSAVTFVNLIEIISNLSLCRIFCERGLQLH